MADQYRVVLRQPLQPEKRSPGLLNQQQLVEFIANMILKPGLHPARKITILNDTLQAIEIERVDVRL